MKLIFSLLLLGSMVATADTPDVPTVKLNIEAQPLGQALDDFSTQSGLQVVFYSRVIAERYVSPALKGKFSPNDALQRLLANTPLQYKFVNSRTVAIHAREDKPVDTVAEKTTAAQMPDSALHLVQASQAATPDRKAAEEKTETKTEETVVQVTGSRIRGLVGEQSSQPVRTITREDIERYGVSSLGDLFAFIPQISTAEIGQLVQQPVPGSPLDNATANRVSADLRGAPPGGTLLLVNGRRVPKVGQAGQAGGQADNEGYDLGGIPLSAIERIDILLDGASAIYGADAVGGVINVILRENYSGTEARVSYENTFDTDVSVKTFSLTHGFSAGRFSAMVSGSWEDGNSLKWTDRDFLRTFDRRAFGGRDMRATSGFSGRGTISTFSGAPLPGLTVNQVAIPAGSSGVNIPISAYASSGPLPPFFDQGDHLQVTSPFERRGFSGSMDFEFSPALTAFAEVRWNKSETQATASPMVAASVSLPAGAPGNPFGIAVRLRKFFYDLPKPVQTMTNESDSLAVGLRGDIFGDWHYESSIQQVRAEPELDSHPTGINAGRLAAAFASSTPPILAYDSTSGTSPNASGVISNLTLPAPTDEFSRTRTYEAQITGPVFEMPAGKVRVSFGAEYRQDHVDFPVFTGNLSIQENDRSTTGYFAEVRVPLVSDRQDIPLVNKLEASLAVRSDQYSDFPSAVSPRYGLMYKPLHWLMLRGSYGEGYKVPTLAQMFVPGFDTVTFFTPGSALDAFRGNEAVVVPPDGLPYSFAGNPNLRPEQSENLTAGIVVDVPMLTGLSFSIDYYDTKYLDRVGYTTLEDRIVLYPSSITRGPKLPGDPASWLGPVIGYSDLPFNVSLSRVSGYDASLRYRLATDMGEWNVEATANKPTHNEIRTVPSQPPILDSVNTFPWQGNASLSWLRDSLRLGVMWTYRDVRRGNVFIPFPTPASFAAISPTATRWDLHGGYDFGNTRLNVTIFNLLNTNPPLRTGIFLPDNVVLDSRLRRFSINVTHAF